MLWENETTQNQKNESEFNLLESVEKFLKAGTGKVRKNILRGLNSCLNDQRTTITRGNLISPDKTTFAKNYNQLLDSSIRSGFSKLVR